MTISIGVNRSGPYTGNGVTVAFDYDFKITDESNVQVIRTEDGVETTLTLGVDYSVTGVGDNAGQVILTTAPTAAQQVTLLLNVPFTQETDLQNQGAYYAETIEAAFDLAAQRDLQLKEKIDRAVVIPASADVSKLESLTAGILRLSDSANNIDTVANIRNDVQTVAGIAADVQTVADIDVQAVLDASAAAQEAAAEASGTPAVADRSALAALNSALKKTAVVFNETVRNGLFVFMAMNLATQVALDTSKAMYVAPSSDPTGASGAWVRFVREVCIEDFGGGTVEDGITDNTPFALEILKLYPGPVRIKHPKPARYRYTQPDVLIFNRGGVYFEGAAGFGTSLEYVPNGNGTFLKWRGPIQFMPIRGGGLINLSVYSPDITTYSKKAVEADGVSQFLMERVNIGMDPYGGIYAGAWTGGTSANPSVGYYPKGWDFNILRNVFISADMPIQIGKNPYWEYNDHWHWTDLILSSTPVLGHYNCISVDAGVAFSSFTCDGMQSWNGGIDGFHYLDQGGVNSVYAIDTPGMGYVVGDVLALTGGTWTIANPTALVLAVNGAGGITAASIKTPGAGLTAMPVNDLFTCSGGSGTGAKLNAYYVNSFNMTFRGVRGEQGYTGFPGSTYMIALKSGGLNTRMTSVDVEGCYFDGYRNGVSADGVKGLRITGCSHTGNNSYAVSPFQLANGTCDEVDIVGCQWLSNAAFPLTASTGGLHLVEYEDNPTTTNAAAYQNAKYRATTSYVVPVLQTETTNLLSADYAIVQNVYTACPGLATVIPHKGKHNVMVKLSLSDSAAAATVRWRLWAGTKLLDNGTQSINTVGSVDTVSFFGIGIDVDGDVRVELKSTTTTSKVLWNSGGDGLDSKVQVVRLG